MELFEQLKSGKDQGELNYRIITLFIILLVAMVGLLVFVLVKQDQTTEPQVSVDLTTPEAIYEARQSDDYLTLGEAYSTQAEDKVGEDKARYYQEAGDAYYEAGSYQEASDNYALASKLYKDLGLEKEHLKSESDKSLADLQLANQPSNN